MNFTILLPTFKTGKMTAYAVSQFLKYRGRHSVNIIIIDNGGGEGMEAIPKHEAVSVITYPAGLLQSHGIAFDYALTHKFDEISEHFITVESDSFPTREDWLDIYEQDYDLIGSRMTLSGGTYIHPAGTMYRKSNWREAKDFINSIDRFYCESKEKSYYTFSSGSRSGYEDEIKRYLPAASSVFHTGIGFSDDHLQTYGRRSPESEQKHILPPIEQRESYRRIAMEPGQWFCYWHFATGKKILEIPAETVWLPNRTNQQQEYSLMQNGFKHLWGISAYRDCESPELRDIIDFKRKQLEAL